MPSSPPPDPAAALTALDRLTVGEILGLWKLLSSKRLQRSFVDLVIPGALLALVTAQQAAATIGAGSIATDVLVDPASFAGLASDGYELPTKLAQPLITVYRMLAGGMPAGRALAVGAQHMDQVVTTEIHDVSRSASQVSIAADRTYTGWVRQVEYNPCSRCIILAGRVYRWNEGFKRHPKCRCRHVATSLPVGQSSSRPQEYFDSMTRAEQDRVFTADSAESIRLGADMNQIVNARQGMDEIAGHRVTTAGTSRRSWYVLQQQAITRAGGGPNLARITRPRLLPEEIFSQAGGNRARALTMLTENGYIVGDLAAQARRVLAARAVALQ